MKSPGAARSTAALWLRLAETALLGAGISLLVLAITATVETRTYQTRQDRALVERARDPRVAVPDADPLVLGRIEIPRVGVSAIVRDGDDTETLALAVGRVPTTARPGQSGNMVLAGHRDTFFRALRYVRKDDVIQISTPNGRFAYRVEWTRVVKPEDTRCLAPTETPSLTLVTCFPFSYVGAAPKRFIVRASRAEGWGLPATDTAADERVPSSLGNAVVP